MVMDLKCGAIAIEGKTKIVYNVDGDRNKAILVAKDDITAGDGKKHDVIVGKAKWATRTTCNVFRLLQACGLPVAFHRQVDEVSFLAPMTQMLPYEVVVRREAHGSYLKRNAHLHKGHYFPKLIVEFYLKTKDKSWKGKSLICDDPYMLRISGNIFLYDPTKPISHPFLQLPNEEVYQTPSEEKLFPEMEKLAKRAFLALERAWQLQGKQLVDSKVEFGIHQGKLLLADVIDNDSWRLLEAGKHIDKQVYRDGGDLGEIARGYGQVAEMTDRFELPHQEIILWRGSEKDKLDSFIDAFDHFFESVGGGRSVSISVVTCSVHKETAEALDTVYGIQGVGKVVIAYIGMSNGAGPVLAAHMTRLVIAVPANAKEFPDDVWSSLRVPSRVPLLVALNPANALQAAFNALSEGNPQLYMLLQEQLEDGWRMK